MSTKAAHTPTPWELHSWDKENNDWMLVKGDNIVASHITLIDAMYIRESSNHHDELRTRLYNLKNAVDCLSGVGEPGVTYTVNDAWAKVDLAMKDAHETLKKFIK
jgi:hypothetical protein